MNRISINLKYGDSVHLTDTEDTTDEKLLENLSSLFSVNSVAILKTEKSSVIIRPSDIASIHVEPIVVENEIEVKTPPPPKPEPKEEHIDIITDID
jgi:hypothetical protein